MFGRLIGLGGLLAGVLTVSPSALAQSYPNRTVTIVVTSAAGALTDVLTRAVGQRLSQMWGQNIVVENRGGAGHSIAAMAVKAAPPTATRCWPPRPVSSPARRICTQGQAAVRPGDGFRSGGRLRRHPEALLVNPAVPAKSVAELIALARQKPDGVTYGTAGLGSALHTGALLLQSLTGVKMTAVHYRGAAPALNDLIAGHINMVTMGPSVALPASTGRLKMLASAASSASGVSRRADHRRDRAGLRGDVSFGLFALADAARRGRQDQRRRAKDHRGSGVSQEIPGASGGPATAGSQQAFADYLKKEWEDGRRSSRQPT